MRVDLHKPVSVRRGDTVAITAKLPRGMDFARLSVWSATPGIEMSPHVFTAQLFMTDSEGRPQMVRPMSMNLHELRRKYRAEFIADEDLDFVVRQDIDVPDDPKAKARIVRHGKAYSSLRQFCRDALRALRSRTARGIGRSRRNGVV